MTTFLVGSFELDSEDSEPLRNLLPSFLHFRKDKNRTRTFEAILEMLATETSNAGLASEVIVSRLYELLFLHALRDFAYGCLDSKGGWLAALNDSQLCRAVNAMHENISQFWTVESLAAESGMSRSAFALRFKTVVGKPPLDYLTFWRVQKAKGLIRKSNLTLSEVALAVGYRSESAFLRVFKNALGMTPGEFKKARDQRTGPPLM